METKRLTTCAKGTMAAMAAMAIVVVIFGLVIVPGEQQRAEAQEEAPSAASDPMQFARGAKIWGDNCAFCHNMRDTRSLRDDQWRAAVAHMRVRANLTGQEARDVLAFLQQSN